MKLAIRCVLNLSVQNIRPNDIMPESRMPCAEVVVGNTTIPCVIQRKSRAHNLVMTPEDLTAIIVFDRIKQTPYNRLGYESVSFTGKSCQFHLYVHKDNLEQLFGAIAVNALEN